MTLSELKQYPFYNCMPPLLEALGWKGTERQLFNSIPYDIKSFSDREFVSVISSLGFKLDFIKGSYPADRPGEFPCLFFNRDNVYVVIRQDEESYLYYDSHLEQYQQGALPEASGVFIFFSFKDKYETTLKDLSPNWFELLLKRFKGAIVKSVVISFFLSVLALISPLFVILIYNQASIAEVETNFWWLSIGIVIYILALVGFKAIRSLIIAAIVARMANILNCEVFKRLLYFPPHISESGSVGNQLSRLRAFDSIISFFSGPGPAALFDIPFVAVLLFGMFVIGGQIALIPLVAIVIFLFMGAYYAPLVKKFSDRNANLQNEKNEHLLETVTKFNSIRNFSLENTWVQKFELIQRQHIESKSVSNFLNSSINTISNSIITISALLTIGVGVHLVIEGEMNAGSLMACVLILWKVLNPLRTVFSISAQFHRLKSSIKQINRFMNLPQEEYFEDSLVYTNQLQGKIQFKQVSVRYTQNALPTLVGVDFTLEQGETLVILGHQGAGKTAIIKMMLGLITPQAGSVLIDDMNLKQIGSIRLRQEIAYAPQEPTFFNESVIHGLLLENPNIDEEQMWKLFRELKIDEEIEKLPHGVHTTIDEDNSHDFSYSLLKRLSIARALLNGSQVKVFDNIERNLDARDNQLIQHSLQQHKGQLTMVVTTQDMSYLDLADKVLWLDKGRVKMFGPADKIKPLIRVKHEELTTQEDIA